MRVPTYALFLTEAEFHHQPAVSSQFRGGGVEHRLHIAEAAGTAEQRHFRLVSHVGGQCRPVAVSDIRRVGGNQIEVSDELLGPQTNKTVLTADGQIPEPIKELNNKKISLRGFMLPLKVEGGLVTEMLIMKDQSMCCYGATPRINEWVSVKMKGGVKPLMDEPVTLMGTLKVGETRENGYLVGIYAMDGDKMGERN